jgi:hypothetical protein
MHFQGRDIRTHLINFCDSPIFDTQRRFIYMAINKVCQQSIARGLLKHRVIVKKDSLSIHEMTLASISDLELETIFKFGIVRNPYDRFVSAFSYLQRIKEIDKHMDFNQFVRRGNFSNPHFNPQHHNVMIRGTLFVDYLARFDSINADWKKIADIIKAAPILPLLNKTAHKPYQELYNKESQAIIADYYRDDFRLLGYTP